MPIFEYVCKACGKSFEKLVAKATDESFPCPECGAITTEKKLSAFNSLHAASNEHQCPAASACQETGEPCCGGKCQI